MAAPLGNAAAAGLRALAPGLERQVTGAANELAGAISKRVGTVFRKEVGGIAQQCKNSLSVNGTAENVRLVKNQAIGETFGYFNSGFKGALSQGHTATRQEASQAFAGFIKEEAGPVLEVLNKFGVPTSQDALNSVSKMWVNANATRELFQATRQGFQQESASLMPHKFSARSTALIEEANSFVKTVKKLKADGVLEKEWKTNVQPELKNLMRKTIEKNVKSEIKEQVEEHLEAFLNRTLDLNSLSPEVRDAFEDLEIEKEIILSEALFPDEMASVEEEEAFAPPSPYDSPYGRTSSETPKAEGQLYQRSAVVDCTYALTRANSFDKV